MTPNHIKILEITMNGESDGVKDMDKLVTDFEDVASKKSLILKLHEDYYKTPEYGGEGGTKITYQLAHKWLMTVASFVE